MDDKTIHHIKECCIKILNMITASDSMNIYLYGESGTGKSYLLEKLHSFLTLQNYSCIILKGDNAKKEIDYYPFDEYLEKIYRIRKAGTNVILNVIGEIPIVGKPTRSVLKEVIDYNQYIEQKDILNTNTFQTHQDFSLQLFSLLNEKKGVVIICDDYQYFDLRTRIYLDETIRKMQHELSLYVHLVYSINTSVPNYESKIVNNDGRMVQLQTPDKVLIKKIIMEWGYKKEISDEMLNSIYISTGGHLYLIKCILEYLETGEVLYSSHLTNKKSLLFRIIETRLKFFGDKYDDAKKLFCLLSLIGQQASNTEINCLMDNSCYLNEIIKGSISLNLLTFKDDCVYFSHEIIKKCFDLFADEFSSSFLLKYANCIKEISPFHYAKRAVLQEKMKNNNEADIYYALYAIQKIRKGLFSEITTVKERLSSSNKESIADFVDNLSECYKLLFNGYDTLALNQLYSMPDSLPFYLLMEKQYLIHLILFKSNHMETRKKTLDSLNEIIIDLEKDELEIWSRYMFLKFALEAEVSLKNEAHKTRIRLINTLSKRVLFDKESTKLLNRICLYSDIIDPPEVSHKKLISLISTMENEVNNEQYDSLLELYIAESNLSGNALIIGEYNMALKSSYKAVKMIDQFPLICFSHREVCYNNLYISLFFKNNTDIAEIIDKYSQIVQTNSEEDFVLISCNYAGLLASDKRYEEALNIMKSIECDEETDRYYLYYFLLNYSIILYLNSEQDMALQILLDAEKYIDYVSPNISKYYQMHYKILYTILTKEDFLELYEIQQKFEDMQPFYLSPIWEKFKKGYLFSDLQIWTEV